MRHCRRFARVSDRVRGLALRAGAGRCPFSRRLRPTVAHGPQPSRGRQADPAVVRRLSVDEAVKLALEQNLGIQIERLNPQIQDIAIAQARSSGRRHFTSTLTQQLDDQSADQRLLGRRRPRSPTRGSRRTLGLNQTAADRRATTPSPGTTPGHSTNIFNNFDPLLRSNVHASTSPSRCCATSRSTTCGSSSRSAGRIARASDLQLRSTIIARRRAT